MGVHTLGFVDGAAPAGQHGFKSPTSSMRLHNFTVPVDGRTPWRPDQPDSTRRATPSAPVQARPGRSSVYQMIGPSHYSHPAAVDMATPSGKRARNTARSLDSTTFTIGPTATTPYDPTPSRRGSQTSPHYCFGLTTSYRSARRPAHSRAANLSWIRARNAIPSFVSASGLSA